MASPRAPLAVDGPKRGELLLDDGVTLVADIYRPADGGSYPVLLMRQPYGRAIASTIVLAHPAWYAAQGYIVVVQDVRGCGSSGGDFQAFVHEVRDGARTLDWVATLEGCNGKIGLYGFSYQAMTQYLAIAGGGRRPDAIAPSMGSWSPKTDWAYEGGAFRLELNASWAAQMAQLKLARQGDAETYQALDLQTPAAILDTLASRRDLSHLAAWLENDDAHWQSFSPCHLLAADALRIPALRIGGWADFLLAGTCAADAAFRNKSPDTTHLIIGPWAHLPWNRFSGSQDMGPDAEFSVDRAQVAFFDFYLKGEGSRPQPLRLFDMGLGHWHNMQHWPVKSDRPFYPSSTGLAAALLSDGRLGETATDNGCDYFVHDPTRPAPLIGGHLGKPNGFADRSFDDNRADVAVYTTPPFQQARRFVGDVAAEIAVETEAKNFDLCAALSLVSPDGKAHVLSTGYCRHQNSGEMRVRIGLRSICVTVQPGFALRLSLQGAGVPAFEVNSGIPGSQQPVGGPITISICHGGSTDTCLIMPEVLDHVA